jgi:hypothetical protein
MDEVRRLRFFIPVAIFIMTIAVFSPDAVVATSRELQRMVEARTPGRDASSIIPTAILLAIGSSLAIGLGFVISTIVQGILLVSVEVWNWFWPPKPVAPPPTDSGRLWPFAEKNFVQHTAPEKIQEWIVRRWEMVIVSLNSIAAIVLAFAVLGFQLAGNVFALWILVLVAFVISLLICAARSQADITAMTDVLRSRPPKP